MVELSPERAVTLQLRAPVVVDTVNAGHEAGDLLQAGLDVSGFATLADVIRQGIKKPAGPVLFKSCGWTG